MRLIILYVFFCLCLCFYFACSSVILRISQLLLLLLCRSLLFLLLLLIIIIIIIVFLLLGSGRLADGGGGLSIRDIFLDCFRRRSSSALFDLMASGRGWGEKEDVNNPRFDGRIKHRRCGPEVPQRLNEAAGYPVEWTTDNLKVS
jgi:hypothetical protein